MTDKEKELKDLIPIICDSCHRLEQCLQEGDGLFKACSFRLGSRLYDHGYRQQGVVVLEVFERLTAMMKQNVADYNVNYFSEVKCYMIQLENEYIKRCYKNDSKSTNGDRQD